MQHFVRGGDTVLAATSDYSLLSAYAVRRTNGALTLLVINKDPTNTLTSDVALSGFVPNAEATVRSYGIPQDEAARTNASLEAQDIATSTFGSAASAFSYSFPPYSLTLLTFTPAGAPSLSILLTTSNTAVVFWPVVDAYDLQTNSDLSTTNWGDYASALTTINGTNSVIITPSTGNLFFRLKQQ